MLRDDFVLWLPGLEGSISYIAALLVHTVVKVLVDFTGESRNLPLASEAASIKPSSAERGGGWREGGRDKQPKISKPPKISFILHLILIQTQP